MMLISYVGETQMVLTSRSRHVKKTWLVAVMTLLVMAAVVQKVHAAPRRARDVDASDDDEPYAIFPEPWQINQFSCPPSLCGSAISQANAIGAPEPGEAQPFNAVPMMMLSAPVVYPFLEGDIVLDREQEERMAATEEIRRLTSRRRQTRNIIRPITKLWTYGVVPYVIDDQMNAEAKKYVRAAFRHYERKTCLRFEHKTMDDENYLHYIGDPGCWSFVGMKGGEQYISIGQGCEHFGTVVHETGHALGFWHTQSRRDRDKYIRILTGNISPSASAQFRERDSSEITSRGFAYDYESIMHYGGDYFSRNGKDTMKVKGVGAKLGFTIGQRRGLSDLDIAMLNSMYYCNSKDMKVRVCGDGDWTEHGGSCYQFYRTPELHFFGARKACQEVGAHLVFIEKKSEDDFIKDFLATHYPNSEGWRTGGKKLGSSFVWYTPGDQAEMSYTAWDAGQPGLMSTLVLMKIPDSSPPRFEWHGAWQGSESQLPRNGYSYICEKDITVECVSPLSKGQDYRGEVSYTAQAITCQNWNSLYPHNHTFLTGDLYRDEDINGLGDHNFCRNPDKRRARPWCFTTLADTNWQYCDLGICNSSS